MGIHRTSLQRGFSTVELLVTLLVASLFIGAGYSLYAFVLSDTGTAKAETKAMTTANEYLEQFRVSSTSCPPTNAHPYANTPITVPGLSNVLLSVDITCPDGAATATTKVLVTVAYGNSSPQKTIQVSSYAGPETSDTQDYNIGSSFSNSSAPTTPTFSWTAQTGATSYDVKYKVYSAATGTTGSWSAITNVGNNTTFTYPYPATAPEIFRNDVVYIQVTAKNGTNDLTSSKAGSATIPAWNDCTTKNAWLDYGAGYVGAQFTKTAQGVVMMRGLEKWGTMSAAICTLPAGFRPSYEHWYQNYSNGAIGRIDVSPAGDIIPYSGTNAWVSLSDIKFFVQPASPCDSWKNATTPLSNSWTNYNNGYAPLRATKDCIGRVFLEGLLVPGTIGMSTTITNVGASPFNTTYRPAIHTHAATGGYAGGYTSNAIHILDTGELQDRGKTSSYQSVDMMYYPAGIGTWTTLPLTSPWAAYNAYYTPQYTKASDGIVSLRGLVGNNSNTCTGSNVVATLPVGYRPTSRLIFSAMEWATSAVRIDITSNGQVICYNTTIPVNQYVSLNEIRFLTN